ncbi:MAG: YbeD family protein [Hyalangium sp.]|uniref:HP0495 family protein n=1 Tax=Hyalangium sp. TaxID=2028555 RepID=UPI00389A32FA
MTKDGPTAPSDAEEKKPLIEYPSIYTFKVMGVQEHGFAEYVRQLFKRLMGTEISPDSIREQPSSKGKYVSVSVSVYLLSEEHRRAIYAQLHQEKRVIYYL